ncbi:DUF1707 SHOCT-like domain-containing protein [Corynebacterium halotolerans]|uniref:DUF1707 domain-containing protein n=1 Tax=Corynebacterium halotolerans YIM 70093 = DSM 44683 TaxID=1121362 RepID=M1NW11_9CORY|nr:DUF1707 domain-containing protein [Corynebacterium halotolerans]AGF71685.1 hypothetical protein A605_03370 [Corynebacterium halotolerans YIM 70093 = DSM 44683]
MSLPERSRRIGDAERNHALERLSRLTGTGHLDVNEFEERSASVVAARTRGDLDAVLADLPAEASVPEVPAAVAPERTPALRDTRKIAGLALSWVGIFIVAAVLGLPWLILLAPALILGVWLSGRGPSGFYED